MGYRHTGCLQLNHSRAEAYCLATLGQYRVKITLNVVEQMCLITPLFDSGMRCASRFAVHDSNTRLVINCPNVVGSQVKSFADRPAR